MPGTAPQTKPNQLGLSQWDFVQALGVFAFVLFVYRLLSWQVGYPTKSEWQLPVILAFALGAVPILLKVLLFLQKSGASLDLGGFKLDFHALAKTPEIIIHPNLADKGIPLTDSGEMILAQAAAEAERSSIIVIDLKLGDAWYLTRLFAIAAAALQYNTRQTIVFTATADGRKGIYLGHASAPAVALAIMASPTGAATDFTSIYLSVASQLYKVPGDPTLAKEVTPPVLFTIRLTQALLPAEAPVEPWISAAGIQALLGDRLKMNKIDAADDGRVAAMKALEYEGEYVALVDDGAFRALMPLEKIAQRVLLALLATSG